MSTVVLADQGAPLVDLAGVFGGDNKRGLSHGVTGCVDGKRLEDGAALLLDLLLSDAEYLRRHGLCLEVDLTGRSVDGELVAQVAVRLQQFLGQVVDERLDPVVPVVRGSLLLPGVQPLCWDRKRQHSAYLDVGQGEAVLGGEPDVGMGLSFGGRNVGVDEQHGSAMLRRNRTQMLEQGAADASATVGRRHVDAEVGLLGVVEQGEDEHPSADHFIAVVRRKRLPLLPRLLVPEHHLALVL